MSEKPMLDVTWALQTLMGRKRSIAALFLAFYSLFVVVYFVAPPRYPSVSKWISTPKTPLLSGLAGFGSLLGANLPASDDDFANYSDIIMSTEFLNPLLKEKVYIAAAKDSVELKRALERKTFLQGRTPSADALEEEAYEVKLIDKLRSSLDFMNRASVYQLRVKSWDPGLSQSLNQKIIARAIEYNFNERQSKSKRKRKFLGGQLEDFKSSLRKSEDELVAFQQRNIAVQNPALMIQRERLAREVEINGQLVLEFRKQFELTRADEDNEAVEISVIEKPTYPFYKSFPSIKILIVGGAICSFIMGTCAILLLEYLKGAVRKA